MTDGAGIYRIINLDPGVYTLTFTLEGFSQVKRDGVELTGSATLTIPVEMPVGNLQEVVTVSGEKVRNRTEYVRPGTCGHSLHMAPTP